MQHGKHLSSISKRNPYKNFSVNITDNITATKFIYMHLNKNAYWTQLLHCVNNLKIINVF